jgi:hypothetical protein
MSTKTDKKKKDEEKKDENDTNNEENIDDEENAESEKRDKKEKRKKSEKNKTESIIPNTLTILIKTRIPNNLRLNYDPSMTVPTSKSHTVYFDPLIKYNKKAILDIPSNAPPDSKYTQFFEANQFDSLVNRTLSKLFSMQKIRNLEEATKENLINENIQITLSSLFKRNGLFYINKRPYTILDRHWKTNSWEIDTKPGSKLMAPYTTLSYTDAMKEAEDELKALQQKYPGATGSSKEKNEEIIEEMKTGTKMVVEDTGIRSETFKEEEKFITANFFVSFDGEIDLNTDPISLSLLIGQDALSEFTKKNIENDIGKSISKHYKRYTNAKMSLLEIKNRYESLRLELGKYQGYYDDASITIFDTLIHETNFDTEVAQEVGEEDAEDVTEGESERMRIVITDSFKKEFKEQLLAIPDLCEDLYNYYINFLQLLSELSKTLVQLYDIQISYFNAIVDYLKELKKEYTNIIGYYKKDAELANMCFDEDIRIYELLSAKTCKNEDDDDCLIYFKNIETFKKKDKLISKEVSMTPPEVNIDELVKKYVANPFLLIQTRKLLGIYSSIVSSSYNVNQLNIWKIYYRGVETLIDKMTNHYFVIMEKTLEFSTKLEETVVIEEDPDQGIEMGTISLKDSDSKFPFTGIKKNTNAVAKAASFFVSFNDKVPEKWILVNDGTPAIPTQKKELKEQEREYIELIKLEVNLFDCIILITHILQIKCLRQHSLYIAELNVGQLDSIILKLQYTYYAASILFRINDENTKIENIFNALGALDPEFKFNDLLFPNNMRTHYIDILDYDSYTIIPPTEIRGSIASILPSFEIIPSIFWNKLINKKDIIEKLDNIFIEIFIQRHKINYIKFKLKEYPMKCNEFQKILYPKMGQQGIKSKCLELLNTFDKFTDFTKLVSFSFFNSELNARKIDIKNTVEFNKNIKTNAATRDIKRDNEWIIYNPSIYKYQIYAKDKYIRDGNDHKIIDEIPLALDQFLGCIKDALNNQLDLLNAITINLYADIENDTETEKIKGTKRFTIASLRRLLAAENNKYKGFARTESEYKAQIKEIKKNQEEKVTVTDQEKEDIKQESINNFNTDATLQQSFMETLTRVLGINIFIIDMNMNNIFNICDYINKNNITDNIIFLLATETKYQVVGDYEGKCMFTKKDINFLIDLCENISELDSSSVPEEIDYSNLLPDVVEQVAAQTASIISKNDIETIEEIIPKLDKVARPFNAKINELEIKKENPDRKSSRSQRKTTLTVKSIESIETEINQENESRSNKIIQKLNQKSNKIININYIQKFINDIKTMIKNNKFNRISDDEKAIIINLFKRLTTIIDYVDLTIDSTVFNEDLRIKSISFEDFKTKIETIRADIQEIESQLPSDDMQGGGYLSDDSDSESDFIGGADRERPSKEFYNYAQINNNPFPGNPYAPVSQYPGNPYIQPGNPYAPVSQYPGSPYPGSPYAPVSQYPGSPYPGSPYAPVSQYPGSPYAPVSQYPGSPYPGSPYPGSPYPGIPNGTIPVNQYNTDYYNHYLQYNIAKENKSKLSYYITIELELYPGKSVGTVKKYAMKCQNTFDKVRKAWADLFGYEYRPSEVTEAYAYETEFDLSEKEKADKEIADKEKEREKERLAEKELGDADKKGGNKNRSKGRSIKSRKHMSLKKRNKSKNRSLKKNT